MAMMAELTVEQCTGSVDEESSLAAWTRFLAAYADGIDHERPTIPPLTAELQAVLDETIASGRSLPPTRAPPITIGRDMDQEVARAIRRFYCEHAYLPPPRSPREILRDRCIREYDIYSPAQIANIQIATNLITAFFPGTIATFSLVQDRLQQHFALSGPADSLARFSLVTGVQIPSEDSLCGHAILRNFTFSPDLRTEWRYKHNPITIAGFRSYIGSTVTLASDPLDPLKGEKGEGQGEDRIGIGILNICFVDAALEVLTPQQDMVVKGITAMLETQLRATWEGHRRTHEARTRNALSQFIQDILVSQTALSQDEVSRLAMGKLLEVLPEVTSVRIIDLQSLQEQFNAPGITSIAQSRKDHLPDLPSHLLHHHLVLRQVLYTMYSKSGLEDHLPSETTSHLFLPFHSDNQPYFCFLVTTANPYYELLSADIDFIRSIGSVLLAKAIQARVIQSDAAKTKFLSSISHELRTPMHGILSSLEMLRLTINEESSELLGLAESSARSLTNILNDVLDSGKDLVPQPEETVDLLAVLVHSVKLVHGQYPDSVTHIEMEYEDRDWMVTMDPMLFQRLLSNGLSNALKFCGDGEVRVRLIAEPNNIVVEIIDTGIGFDPSLLPLILKPFVKLDSSAPGSGLGLHLSQAIVKGLGGKLELRSAPGKGTVFTANLPLGFVQPPEPNSINGTQQRRLRRQYSIARQPDIVHRADTPVHTSAIRVLVVDDNAICRKLLVMALKRSTKEISTVEAVDGAEALARFRSWRPDIVLTDISMPVMNGIESAGKMRQEEEPGEKRAKIYAITALGSADVRLKEYGLTGKPALDGWLTKGKDLSKAVYRILDTL